MLAVSVYTGKGLFMQQADQTVLGSDLLHDLHGELVVVGCDVGRGIDRGKLVLRRRNLVVLGFCEDSQLPQFFVQFLHKSGYARLDDAKVVIVHFLPLGRLCAEQGTPGKAEIGALVIHFLCDEKIFLLRTDITGNALDRITSK